MKRTKQLLSALAIANLLSLAAPLVGAEVAAPAPENLSLAAKEAAKSFRPITPQDVAAAKAELAAAVAELDALLRRSMSAYDAGWRKYLKWDDLQTQLRAEGPDPKTAEALLDKLSTPNVNGLEDARFARVRHALRNYLDISTAAADPKLQETFGTQITDLAARLEGYDKTNSGDDAVAISRTLGWLRRGRQAGPLADAIQRRYSKPSLYASVAQHFLATAVEDDIDQTLPVSDNILGTSLQGTAHTTGRTRVELQPNEEMAQFDIFLTGQAISNNVGHNRGVTIYSTGATTISGRKSLYMTPDGMTSNSAAARCATSSNIYGIAAKCGLIEKIAWKKAGQQQGQAEVVASSHAAGRVQEQMDTQAAGIIADANRDYNAKVRGPLSRRDGFPKDLRFRSQPEMLQMISLQTNQAQLGAPSDPPAPKAPYDVTVQAHESSIINFGETMIGGVTLTDERLEQIIRDDLQAEVPEELKVTQEKDPWSITFTNEVPVRAVFGDGTVSIAIRGRRFTRGDQRLSEPIEISGNYKIEKTDKGSKLTRQGEVNVKFLERERLGAPQIAFKTFLTRKFEALFKPEIVGDGIVLTGRLEKAGKLQIQEISTGKGWVVLGWNLVPNKPVGVAVAER